MILTDEQINILRCSSWAGLVLSGKDTDLDIGGVIIGLATEVQESRAKIAELNKLVEEAQAARAGDHKRMSHYERLLKERGISDPKAYVDAAVAESSPFKPGDRCLYNLRPGFEDSVEIPVTVVRVTPKRVRIRDIGRYGSTRNVMAKSLRIDPSPSPED